MAVTGWSLTMGIFIVIGADFNCFVEFNFFIVHHLVDRLNVVRRDDGDVALVTGMMNNVAYFQSANENLLRSSLLEIVDLVD